MHNKSNLFVLGGLVGSTVVTGMVLAGPQVIADENHTATASVTVASVCSMTANVTSAHTATVTPGVTTGDIGLTTITAFCNDNGGFAVYAIGFSNDEYGNTDMIGSIPGYDIATGTATSGPTSQWSMKVSASTSGVSTGNYNNYHAVPSDYEKVASYGSKTDTSGAKITTTYRAYIAPAQVAATYTGQVKYTMVHPSEADAPEIPCDGIKTGETCITSMQTFGELDATTLAAVKNAMVLEQQYQLRDSRDDKMYLVAKLKDGNIWMTQNLAIAGTTIKAEDSDFESGTFTLPNAKWNDSMNYSTPGAYVENGETYYNWDAATAGTGRGMSTAGTDAPGSICPKGWKLPKSGKVNGTSGAPRDLAGSFYNLWKSYITTGSWNSSSAYWSGVTMSQFTSVPLSLTFSGHFYPYQGGGEVYDVGDGGCWWSSTVDYSVYVFYGYVGSYGYVRPALSDGRLNGRSVRCVAAGE